MGFPEDAHPNAKAFAFSLRRLPTGLQVIFVIERLAPELS